LHAIGILPRRSSITFTDSHRCILVASHATDLDLHATFEPIRADAASTVESLDATFCCSSNA
jgi:hypothetical protein